MKKIFASPTSRFRLDLNLENEESHWDIVDGLWELPELERTVIAVRYGASMTLADIGDALGVTPDRIWHLEGQAIASVADYVEAAHDKRRGDAPDDGEHE